MRPRIVALAAVAATLLATVAGLGYTEKQMVPPTEQTSEFSFLPGSNDPTNLEWNRENYYINLSNWVRQGLGPKIPFNQIEDKHLNPDRIKVLTVGDSFSWGTGAFNFNERWQNQLQAELDRRAGSGTFEVQSLGIMGASAMEEAEFLADNVERLDPDLIVIGIVSNDMFPSGRERSVCGDDIGPSCSQDTPELLPEYRDCVTGKSDITSKMISYLGSLYPNVSKKLMDRYCDLSRFAKQFDMLTQEEIRRDPIKSPHRQLFLQSTRDMKKAAGGRPIYAYSLAHTQSDSATSAKLEPSYEQAGIEIIPASKTTKTSAARFDGKSSQDDGVINPVDYHPGPIFTKLFSEDVATGILASVDPAKLVKARSNKKEPARSLVSNYLPVSVKTSETVDGSVVVTLTEDNKIDETLPTYNEGRIPYPAKDAPCAFIGHPHAFIGLNPALTETGKITVTYLSGPELSLYLGSYDNMGRRITKLAGQLRIGTSKTFDVSGAGNETLFVSDRSRDCNVNERHTLEPFSLRISASN
jgi:hypothetical protein